MAVKPSSKKNLALASEGVRRVAVIHGSAPVSFGNAEKLCAFQRAEIAATDAGVIDAEYVFVVAPSLARVRNRMLDHQ